MSSHATQDRIAAPQTAPAVPSYAAPAWSPVQAETSQATPTAQPGLSDEQRALDEAAAAEAGMGPSEVSTLSTFGLRPSEMDIDAARRVNVGLQRMAALIACEDGNTTACELAGPGLIGHESWEGVSGDTSEDLVVEGAEFTLRITTRTTPDGQAERVLSYQDIDGTYLSGVSAEPIEVGPSEQAPDEQAPAAEADEEGLGSFLEGALLGDLAGNDSWSAIAGQTVMGLIPGAGQIADARDTLAALCDVANGKDGSGMRLAAAGIGWVPVVGDMLKGGARVGMHLGTELVEEGAERLVKEAAEEGGERLAREGAEEATEEAGEQAAKEGAEDGAHAATKAKHVVPSRQPDPNATPGGRRTRINPNDKSPEGIRGITRENESADVLARSGYDIEQNPSVPGPKNPDYRIEGEIFDNYAPSNGKPRNIWKEVNDKVVEEQAPRIVLNLDDSAVDLDALRSQFASWPIEGLQQLLVIRGGQIVPFTF